MPTQVVIGQSDAPLYLLAIHHLDTLQGPEVNHLSGFCCQVQQKGLRASPDARDDVALLSEDVKIESRCTCVGGWVLEQIAQLNQRSEDAVCGRSMKTGPTGYFSDRQGLAYFRSVTKALQKSCSDDY